MKTLRNKKNKQNKKFIAKKNNKKSQFVLSGKINTEPQNSGNDKIYTTTKNKSKQATHKQGQAVKLKKVKKTKKKKVKRGLLVRKLDNVFSKYIRLLGTNKNGICECYTCGKKGPRKTMQCGHFVSRVYYKYRRDEKNCVIQCVGCNIFLKGNYKIYTLKKIRELGEVIVDNMINDKEIKKISTNEIKEKIEYYQILVDDLLQKLKEGT